LQWGGGGGELDSPGLVAGGQVSVRSHTMRLNYCSYGLLVV